MPHLSSTKNFNDGNIILTYYDSPAILFSSGDQSSDSLSELSIIGRTYFDDIARGTGIWFEDLRHRRFFATTRSTSTRSTRRSTRRSTGRLTRGSTGRLTRGSPRGSTRRPTSGSLFGSRNIRNLIRWYIVCD